jgi:glyoxylase-like metal-dependent hydrolase (beta-lactamase superfamily II)
MTARRVFPLVMLSVLLAACGKGPSTEAPDISAAASAPAVAPSDRVHPFQIGALQAFSLKEADFKFPNDAKTVAINRPVEETSKLLEASGLPTDEIALSVQPLLVKAEDKVLLFDAGTGGGTLLASLQEAGLAPADVTDVLISHSHFDHVGGLVNAEGQLVFANAAIRMSAKEWDAVKASAESDEKRAAFVAAVTPKVSTFDADAEIFPGLVKAVDIQGHTPGHSGYLITSGAESLLYIGDMAHHSIVSVQEPDWTISFDGDAATAQASRKAVIEQSAANGQRIYAVHFPFPGLGAFTAQGDGYVWTPEE